MLDDTIACPESSLWEGAAMTGLKLNELMFKKPITDQPPFLHWSMTCPYPLPPSKKKEKRNLE